jgi:hypothetical protein
MISIGTQQEREVSPLDVARANGRGVSVFRPAEAAIFLGCDRAVVDAACKEFITSRGRRGLAHFLCGKGLIIRRESLTAWMQHQERAMAGF